MPRAQRLAYSTYLPGTAATYGSTGIAVDGSGNAYVTGYGPTPSFQTTPGAFHSGTGDVFVAKLNAAGSAFGYAASLGSDGVGDQAYHIAVDGSGNAYVTGLTGSSGFPTTPGAFQSTRASSPDGLYQDAFVTELNAAGTALVYSTYLGGSGSDNGFLPSPFTLGGIAVDSSGKIDVTGCTNGGFPTKNALQATYGGPDQDAFVAELDPSQVGAASLVYSTYLGGSDRDIAYGDVRVDGSGNAYVTGETSSTDFPTQNAYQPQLTPRGTRFDDIRNAFVTKITSQLSPVHDLGQPEVPQGPSVVCQPETWAVPAGANGSSKTTGVPPHPSGAVDVPGLATRIAGFRVLIAKEGGRPSWVVASRRSPMVPATWRGHHRARGPHTHGASVRGRRAAFSGGGRPGMGLAGRRAAWTRRDGR